MKTKTLYECQSCTAQFPKWMGQCGDCGAWNSLIESLSTPASSNKNLQPSGYAGTSSDIINMSEVDLSSQPRLPTGMSELDRVLGGGLVPGSVVLIGGDPGIGKSTLLLAAQAHLNQDCGTLYVTGEESLQQVTRRAERLELNPKGLKLLAETQLERIIQLAQKAKPEVIVIDSIQTMFSAMLQSAPGAVGQVRECAGQLVRYAKQTSTIILLVGHVTKEGTLAGPRVLEHMVDCVLYFEGEQDSRFRLIRAVKNRFGAVNELGIFAMTDRGLREVANPSAIFLTREQQDVPGSCIMVSWEGTRPMLVEIQALVDSSHLGNPRRVTVGLEQNRLAMLLAVLHRHGGIASYDQDVFVNVVGGVKITETAIDLALLLAVISSLRNKPLPQNLVVFGEVGLSGEIRPVQSGQSRLKEAAKHGFKRAIVPKANQPKKADLSEIEVHGVTSLAEAIAIAIA